MQSCPSRNPNGRKIMRWPVRGLLQPQNCQTKARMSVTDNSASRHNVEHPPYGGCTWNCSPHALLFSVSYAHINKSADISCQIFTRNKMIGWTSVLFSIQTWLSETPAQKEKASTPGYFSVGTALLGLGVAYLPLFMPPPGPKAAQGTGTGAPGPVPQ